MTRSDPKHPIWPIIKIAVIMLGVTFFIWLNVEKFDGEWVQVGEILLVVIAAFFPELARNIRNAMKGGSDDDSQVG